MISLDHDTEIPLSLSPVIISVVSDIKGSSKRTLKRANSPHWVTSISLSERGFSLQLDQINKRNVCRSSPTSVYITLGVLIEWTRFYILAPNISNLNVPLMTRAVNQTPNSTMGLKDAETL